MPHALAESCSETGVARAVNLFFHRLGRVPHGDTIPRYREHVQVVEVVTDGYDVFRLAAQQFGCSPDPKVPSTAQAIALSSMFFYPSGDQVGSTRW